MKHPFPIKVDSSLNMLLDSNTVFFYEASQINFIEIKRAKLIIQQNISQEEFEKAIEEAKEKGIDTQNLEDRKEELEGWQITLYTKKDEMKKNEIFCNNEVALNRFKNNCKHSGLVLINQEENGNQTFLNKESVLETMMLFRTKEEIEQGERELLITFRFETGVSTQELKAELNQWMDLKIEQKLLENAVVANPNKEEMSGQESMQQHKERIEQELAQFNDDNVFKTVKELYYQIEIDIPETTKEFLENKEYKVSDAGTILSEYLDTLS